jgi:hypothetical protein
VEGYLKRLYEEAGQNVIDIDLLGNCMKNVQKIVNSITDDQKK